VSHGGLKGKIPSPEESMVVLSPSELVCHKCDQKFKEKKAMMSHLAVRHFKTSLIRRFPITAGNTCSVCFKNFKGIKSLLGHLASEHNALDDQVPKGTITVPQTQEVTVLFTVQ
jgi:hypothetical protein